MSACAQGVVRQRGLALIVVLWAGALLTLLGASFAFSLRTEARLATTLVDRAGAGAAAQAGLQRLAAVLMAQGRGARTAVHGRMQFEGFEVDLEATPESARVDLNAAPPALLLGLVEQVIAGIGSDAPAQAIVDALLDWRDADDEAREAGAEAEDYEAAGLTARPRNGALLSIEELAQVKGMTPALFRALKPLVTVYAWTPQVDAMTASRTVLLALPGATPAQVDAFLEARVDGPAALALLTGSGRYVSRNGGTVFSLVARARAASGVVVSRRSVVKVNARARQPAAVLAWFAGVEASPAGDDEAAGTDPDAQER